MLLVIETDLKSKIVCKFSTAFCALRFRAIHRILVSWDVIVRCPLGRHPVMRKPLGRVLSHLRSFCQRKSARIPETVFCSCRSHLFQ